VTDHARKSTANRARAGTGRRPTAVELAAAQWLLRPWQWLTSPKFYGLEHVPKDRPVLLVGNHTLMGVLDVPLMAFGLYEQRGVFVRALGDHLHFRIPLWRDLLQAFGSVDGTPENCRALMRAGETILVFPGGGREVFKRKGEKYRLIWKNRIGFARLAIEHGYPIVPFAAVGAEECFDILVDGDELLRTPLRGAIERLSPRPDVIPPLVRGIGLSPLPRPERFYFRFSKPIATRSLAGRRDDEAACLALRRKVSTAIERSIAFLLAARERDPDRSLLRRLSADLGLTPPPTPPRKRHRPRRSPPW